MPKGKQGPGDIEVTIDPAPAASGATDPAVFDPRQSFYPQTLLKFEDVRTPLPRRAPWLVRHAKPVVAIVLVIALGLAYVFYLSNPAADPPAKEVAKSAPDEPRSTATAAGAIKGPAVQPASPASPAPPALPTLPAPPPVAAVRAPAPQSAVVPSRLPPAASTAPPAGSPRSTVTHTKAAVDAAEGVKPAEAAAVVAVPPPAANAVTGPCSEALAALGLCNPVSRGEKKQ